MKKTGKWIPYLVFIGARGMKVYSKDVVKPPLTPPDAVFPVVWTILYTFMGIGAGRIYKKSRPGHFPGGGNPRGALGLWWGYLNAGVWRLNG